jgi:hypothetical protein
MTGKVETHVSLKLKHKEIDPQRGANERKFFRETTTGDTFNWKNKIWYIINQVVDRKNNRYKKTLINSKTGEIVLDIEERLTDHIGHGEAKKKNNDPES